MNDDPSSFKPLDPGRVNTMDPVEVKYWCKELQCTEGELTLAVEKVGEHVAEIRQMLATMHGHR